MPLPDSSLCVAADGMLPSRGPATAPDTLLICNGQTTARRPNAVYMLSSAVDEKMSQPSLSSSQLRLYLDR